jgi:hypothetical protein
LIEVLELIEDDQQAWLVEDWVEGVSLSALLDAGGAFSAEEAVAIVGDALAGLAHIHQRAIVHGNVAAHSVRLDVSGRPRLTDFGAPAAPLEGWPVTPQSDVRDAGMVLHSLLPSAPPRIEAVLQSSMAAEPGRQFRDAGEFLQALTAAADVEFGAGWRERVDLGRCVRRAATGLVTASPHVGGLEAGPITLLPLSSDSVLEASASWPEPDALVGPTSHPSVHRVKVRSPKRAARPAEQAAEVRDYLQPRTSRSPGRDGNTGRFIPILATVVVVVAIVVLVLTHHDMQKATPSGLAFHGSYDIITTSTSAGVGVDQDRPPGSGRSDKWQVTSICPPAATCTASVVPSSGAVFTLNLDGNTWTGEQSMSASNSCIGVYRYAVKATTSTGGELIGTIVGTATGCGRSGTETASLTVSRTSG